jgi:branched-chain amino acid transport system substrate-binding protein
VQQLYTRLITQDKAQFLLSPFSSGLVATAAIISEQYGKVMITTGGCSVWGSCVCAAPSLRWRQLA